MAHIIAGVFSSAFGTILLVIFFIIACITNSIGTIWMWLGGLVRDESAVSDMFSRNYCHGAIWWPSYVISTGFWVMAFLLIFTNVSRVVKGIIINDERNYQVILLGNLKAGKNKAFLAGGVQPPKK